jgi:hypothetical protein
MENVRQHFKNAAERWQKCVNIFEMFAKACCLVREPLIFLTAFLRLSRRLKAGKSGKKTERNREIWAG